MSDIKAGAPALKVMELFAGVGGFRLGLESVHDERGGQAFRVAWSNQFEPGCKKQYAAMVYQARWGVEGFINRDIDDVLADPVAMAELDGLLPDVLVGGFPCQDYSVARPSGQSHGIEGKKGVLWWSIVKMLQARVASGHPVKYLVFENVDRLLSSPSTCRGRDFAVILASLQSLGYAAEWRVVNSADYGYPQRRRRTFIVGYHRSTELYQRALARVPSRAQGWLLGDGVLGQAFPAALNQRAELRAFALAGDVLAAQEAYTTLNGRSRFSHGGLCIDGSVYTGAVQPLEPHDFTAYVGQPHPMTLGDVVRGTTEVPAEYLVNGDDLARWHYLKGAKSIPRTAATGHAYTFSEGAVPFPDPLGKPSRTIITSEGGASPSRTRHVVLDHAGRVRRLLPDELDVLTGFPRGFTAVPGVPPAKRAFLAGNALVVGVVQQIGRALFKLHSECHSLS